MKNQPEKNQVRLRVDLTRYGAACIQGAIGLSHPRDKSDWSANDKFVKVEFPGGIKLDVLRRDLENIGQTQETTT